MMRLDELIYSDELTVPYDDNSIEITRVTTSADKIDSGTLFVLQKSIKIDVQQIINYILDLKPAVILCDDNIEASSSDTIIIKCKSSRRLLPYILSRFYKIDYSKLHFIGLTGTNGKTTTATVIEEILSFAGKKTGFIGTGKITVNKKDLSEIGYSMTTPDPEYLYSIIKKMQNEGCEYIVMEVSSHALFFDKVSAISFDVSAFTNLSPEHLDFHSTKEEYYKTKLKLFEQSKIGIYNLDDKYSRKAYRASKCKKSSISIKGSASANAVRIKKNGLYSTEYIYKSENACTEVTTSLAGEYNIYNTLMAIRVCEELSIPPKISAAAIKSIKYIDGRLETINDKITVIIDYAHTEAAYFNLLNFLFSNKKPKQKIITVFGCGGDRDKQKRPRIAAVCEKFSDAVIVTNDNPRTECELEIIKDILKGFRSVRKRTVITSRKRAIEFAINMASDGDIVAIIGKGHERYNINKNGIERFDERDIINEALKKRRGDNENNP